MLTTAIRQKLEMMGEMKAMVETLNKNIRVIHVNLARRHYRERQQLLKTHIQEPKIEFQSIAEISSQELVNTFDSNSLFQEEREHEADC